MTYITYMCIRKKNIRNSIHTHNHTRTLIVYQPNPYIHHFSSSSFAAVDFKYERKRRIGISEIHLFRLKLAVLIDFKI